jgi:hypothetical protein
VLVATLPTFPLPSLAPAASANSLHASISASAAFFPIDKKCVFGYKTGPVLEQADSPNKIKPVVIILNNFMVLSLCLCINIPDWISINGISPEYSEKIYF